MAGQVLISSNQFYAFIGIFVAMCIFFLIVILLGMFTPAITFLKAKIRKKDLIKITNRAQVSKFYVLDTKFPGVGVVKKIGPFILTENSHEIENKSHISIYHAFAEFSGTIPLKWAMAMQKIGEAYKAKNIPFTDVDVYAKLLLLKFDTANFTWRKMTEEEVKEIPKEEKDIVKSIEINPYETIEVHSLASKFPFNLHPALIQSKIEHSVMSGKKWASMDKNSVLLWVMVMLGAALATGILIMLIKNGKAAECKVTVEQAAGILRTNYTG